MQASDFQDLHISKKKITYPINDLLLDYLVKYDRYFKSPLEYDDLLDFQDTFPVFNDQGKDTFWQTVMYSQSTMDEINRSLKHIYAWLKSDGNANATDNLFIDSVDLCTFGNSKPFRIKIKNQNNDNHDYFYIKQADASRIYGLELEQILSPNHINFLVYKNTLVEEHISGIPGDVFMDSELYHNTIKSIRLAKEFVKFNERCFLRLLGDQRAYNFVVVLTPDFDQMQYRIRSIDFDQQSYEGKMNLYRPQFFKENHAYVKMVLANLQPNSVKQYQNEERSLMAKRIIAENYRLEAFMQVMRADIISPPQKVEQLKNELYNNIKDKSFKNSQSMGDIMQVIIDFVLRNYLTAHA